MPPLSHLPVSTGFLSQTLSHLSLPLHPPSCGPVRLTICPSLPGTKGFPGTNWSPLGQTFIHPLLDKRYSLPAGLPDVIPVLLQSTLHTFACMIFLKQNSDT